MLSKAPFETGAGHKDQGRISRRRPGGTRIRAGSAQAFQTEGEKSTRASISCRRNGQRGHTLSLFPGTKALHAGARIVVRKLVGKLYADRITLTASVASNAARIIFMVTGADKAQR